MIIWILFLCWWLIAFLPPIYINGKWFMKNIAGLTLAPFIFFKKKEYLNSERFIKHERAHVFQQRVFPPLLFLIIYGLNYVINRTNGMNHYNAYHNIIFEKLARAAEKE